MIKSHCNCPFVCRIHWGMEIQTSPSAQPGGPLRYWWCLTQFKKSPTYHNFIGSTNVVKLETKLLDVDNAPAQPIQPHNLQHTSQPPPSLPLVFAHQLLHAQQLPPARHQLLQQIAHAHVQAVESSVQAVAPLHGHVMGRADMIGFYSQRLLSLLEPVSQVLAMSEAAFIITDTASTSSAPQIAAPHPSITDFCRLVGSICMQNLRKISPVTANSILLMGMAACGKSTTASAVIKALVQNPAVVAVADMARVPELGTALFFPQHDCREISPCASTNSWYNDQEQLPTFQCVDPEDPLYDCDEDQEEPWESSVLPTRDLGDCTKMPIECHFDRDAPNIIVDLTVKTYEQIGQVIEKMALAAKPEADMEETDAKAMENKQLERWVVIFVSANPFLQANPAHRVLIRLLQFSCWLYGFYFVATCQHADV